MSAPKTKFTLTKPTAYTRNDGMPIPVKHSAILVLLDAVSKLEWPLITDKPAQVRDVVAALRSLALHASINDQKGRVLTLRDVGRHLYNHVPEILRNDPDLRYLTISTHWTSDQISDMYKQGNAYDETIGAMMFKNVVVPSTEAYYIADQLVSSLQRKLGVDGLKMGCLTRCINNWKYQLNQTTAATVADSTISADDTLTMNEMLRKRPRTD